MNEMVKTTGALCSKCRYHTMVSDRAACYYIIYTGRNRDCPIGYCNKFEKGRPKRMADDPVKHSRAYWKRNGKDGGGRRRKEGGA